MVAAAEKRAVINHRSKMRNAGTALLLIMLSVQSAASDSRSVRFQNISREQGLSQSFVYTIVQDQEGFMWFGTQDGLNRFDGFEIKIFNHDPDDPQSISDESVRTMIADRSGTLWTGTDAGGLSRYNRDTQTFTNFVHDPEDPDSISDDRVRVVYEDSAGLLWVGTDGAGLDLFDRESEKFRHFVHDPAQADSLAGLHVWGILENSYGQLFIATDGGLSRFDPATDSFIHYLHDPADPSTINDNELRVLFEDTDKNLWIGTASGGLNKFDYESETFEHFIHDPQDASSISANRINAIFQDNGGVLWIGTVDGLNAWNPDSRDFDRYFNNPSDRYSLSHNNVSSIFQDRGGVLWVGTYIGVNWWNQNNRAMAHYRNDFEDPNSLNENTIMAFTEDRAGDIWIGTYGGGLNILDRSTDQFREIRHLPNDDSSLSSDQVMSLLVDHEGILWAGTRAAGLNRFDDSTNTFTRFLHDPDVPGSISADGITFIFEDSRNTLWVGTFGGGINAFDRDAQQFVNYRNDPTDPGSLSNDRVLIVFEDSRGDLWIGTYGGGLNRLDLATGKFTAYRADPDRADGLSGDEIYTIQEDTWGDFWIGVKGRGLNRWRRADREAGREKFQRFNTRDGLPSSTIYAGIWDQSGKLWLSTGGGLSRLDIGSLEFQNYDTSHGLQDDEFNLSAGFRASDGQLFFGGVKGFNAFYPHLLGGSGPPPQVAITKFLTLNNPVDHDQLQMRDGRVQLQYDQNVIGFEFAALDFAGPGKNRFMYMLEGIDDDWVDAGTKRQVTYTNLPAGAYSFRVIASNNDRVWSEIPAVFDLYMEPAPWRTWWAYSLYALAFAAVTVAAFRAYKRSVQQADQLQYAEELGIIQARLTDAQRIAKIGNWEWNISTNALWWSDEVYRLFQMQPGSFAATYDSFMERVHQDDRRNVDSALKQVLRSREPHSIDHRIVRPDGTERVVHERVETTFDDKGEPVGMTGTIHDITDRKKAEDDIRHRAEFQAIFAKLSSELIQAPPCDIDDQIRDGLQNIGRRYELDAIGIWWFATNHEDLAPLYRWMTSNLEFGNMHLDQESIPWISTEILAGKPVALSDVTQMPSVASTDQMTLTENSVKSLLVLPLLVEEKLEGACGFALTDCTRDWTSEMVAELRLISESLAGAIARSRAISKIEHLKNKLQRENRYLREEVKLAHGFDEIIGDDSRLKKCLLAVQKVAPTDVTTLVLGETGTGKELIARAIHKLSSRSDKPMISVNCPALPSTLIESELFGHEKGAFTGAQSKRRGRFELAHTGTLFLDEIGDLPLELQGKLLRVLQSGEFQRIGGTKTIHTDVRLIAATNRDLRQAVKTGDFRADLYYRISSFPVTLPPLRNRRDDIPLLAEHFIHKHAARLGKKIDAISAEMIDELMSYDWPGNVRELESLIERALISAEDNRLLELPGPIQLITSLRQSSSESTAEDAIDLFAVERAHIVDVLEQTSWTIAGPSGAAEILGVPPSTLRSKMKRLGIVRPSH